MKPSSAYHMLNQSSPEAANAIDKMLSGGWSPANIARLLSRLYRRDIARLVLPAATYAANQDGVK